jgi:hypothetical protein
MRRTAAAASPHTIEVPPLCLRAEVGTFDPDTRTVELIFSTGAAVERFDWMTGKRYIEKLAIAPEAVRLERLNAGAPLLDSHSSWSVSDQLGAVVPGTARVEGKRAIATVRFSARDTVAPILRDVQDGIIRSVSVGYRVHKFEEDAGGGNKLPVRTAVDWEPFEISMVSMPADTGAKVRRDEVRTNTCVVISRRETTMNERTELSDTLVENENRIGLAPEDPATGATGAAEPRTEPAASPADTAAKAERARVQGILLACRAGRMPSSVFDKLVADGTPLAEAQQYVFREMEKRVEPSRGVPSDSTRRIEMGEDPLVHKRAGIENALLHRINPERFQLSDVGREYRGMSILDVARTYLNARNIRTTSMDKMELAGVALGLHLRAGMHTTSDFPLLLADVANKSLRADYEAAPQTFMPITRIGTVPDFKAANRVAIGDAPALKPLLEHGEFTRGTIEEGREQVQAATYGRVFGITRTALVNDDLDAFSRVPAKFARMARNLESDLVWYQILKNANMADGTALFAAGHSNYIAAGDIDLGPMTVAEKSMLLQTGLDASTLISAQPRYLIVPPTKKVQAEQFVSTNMMAAQIDRINPFAGRLVVICEPRLETGITIGTLSATGSAYAWYLAADKAQLDILEIVFLEGQNGPVIESRVGFDVDGLEIKCREDVGAKVIDHRGLFKSDGSDNS